MSDAEEDSSLTNETIWPVNEEWLCRIIKQNNANPDVSVTIKKFDVKNVCQHGISNLSDLLTVSVSYVLADSSAGDDKNGSDGNVGTVADDASGQKLNIVVKLLPHDPFGRYFVTLNQFDLREIHFYTKILTDLQSFQDKYLKADCERFQIAVPKCYFSQYTSGVFPLTENVSIEPPESILVLEDMRTYGFKTANISAGLSLAEAESAIRAIAVIHALTLGIKIKEKVDLNEKYPFLFQISKATESYQQLVEQGLPQLTKFLERMKTHKRELGALAQIRPKTKSIIESLLQPIEPMGLITHTDFWCNNLLLNHSGDNDESRVDCIILDWQMITYSRPTNDVALLILSSLPSKIRRDNQQKLLDLYFSELKQNLARISIDLEVTLHYTKEKLLEDYKKSQLLALLLCIGSADVALGNEDAEQRFLDVLHDLYKAGVMNIEQLSF